MKTVTKKSQAQTVAASHIAVPIITGSALSFILDIFFDCQLIFAPPSIIADIIH